MGTRTCFLKVNLRRGYAPLMKESGVIARGDDRSVLWWLEAARIANQANEKGARRKEGRRNRAEKGECIDHNNRVEGNYSEQDTMRI